MDSLTLLDQKEQLKQKANTILDNAQKEERKLNDGENEEYITIRKQIEDIDKQIEQINKDNIKQERKINNSTMEKFSLIKAISDVANGRGLDERSQEVINAGIAEMRKAGQNVSGQIVLPVEERATIQATVTEYGKENVPEDKLGILEPLRAKNVLVNAGASFMTGLVGDVSIPVYSGSSVAWASEVGQAADAAGKFGEVKLSPKRLTAFLDISKQFLAQDSNSAEEMLKRDLINAINSKLEATILGAGDGKAGGESVVAPVGMFKDATATTISYANVAGIEAELEDANVYGDLTYIVSPAIKAKLRTTQKGNGVGFVMENNEIDGTKVLSTSNCGGIVVGSFSDYVIGQWGGIELTVDPYTQAANGKIRLVINAYFDAKPRRAEAFKAYTVA